MLLKEFKTYFIVELEKEYPKEEVQSFFNLLTEAFLKMSRLEVALDPEKELSEAEVSKLKDALQRLQKHEPIQYIIGETEFYGLLFKVNPAVLIPRPETEELVQWIMDDASKKGKRDLNILDIGTGTGCIAISLARNLPDARVSAVDISEGALSTAKENAKLNGVEITFLQKDILNTDSLEKKFDVIVSNPPYVRNLEKQDMQRNVLEFEPEKALYVRDEDPLIFYRKISELAKDALHPEGALYFEINQYLGAETEAILKKKNFQTQLKKDIFGVDRMLKGVKS